MLATYHTHSLFCDGKGSPEDYVLAAIEKGFTALGFTSHAPVTFTTNWTMKKERLQEYLDTIRYLKERYKNQIQLVLGLETDYYPGGPDYRALSELDYTIGSVHFLYHEATKQYMALDGTVNEFRETRDVAFYGDVKMLVKTYYKLLTEMVQKQPPCILGHLDILKKNNTGACFFNESDSWYRRTVEKTLLEVKKQRIIVEVNTGGISRGYTDEVYPSGWILQSMREMNIPVVLNSDAHHPDWIDAYYDKARKIMKSAGYTHQRVLLHRTWQDVKL